MLGRVHQDAMRVLKENGWHFVHSIAPRFNAPASFADSVRYLKFYRETLLIPSWDEQRRTQTYVAPGRWRVRKAFPRWTVGSSRNEH
jgi:hypothetical protein